MAEYYLYYENQNEQKTNSRITEQLIKQETLDYVEELRSTGVEEIEGIKETANAYIDNVKDETNEYIADKKNNEDDGVIKTGKDAKGDIHFEDGDNVDSVICNTSDKGTLGDNYVEAKQIYQDTLAIAPDTEEEIETNIRQYMNDNYSIGIISDDGDGNIELGLTKIVKEGE